MTFEEKIIFLCLPAQDIVMRKEPMEGWTWSYLGTNSKLPFRKRIPSV